MKLSKINNKERKLKILFVAAEVAPFSSVGGLSQVMYFLSRALIKLGHDVRIFTPKFGLIDEKNDHPKELICNVKVWSGGSVKDPFVYFLENEEYYEQRANVYQYQDDHV